VIWHPNKRINLQKIIFIALWNIVSLSAEQSSVAKVMKLAQKGERIVKVMCEADKLPQASNILEKTIQSIKASQACPPLSQSKLEAVAYFVTYGSTKNHSEQIAVPHDAKCPVCGMFVSKYPKWVAMMKIEEKIYYFDGVKDMMKYYIFDGDFIYNRNKITKIYVNDYYTLEAIPAKKAFYVLDSDVYGPMGHELIPFKTKKSAEAFKEEHHGKAVLKFNEITDHIVMALDGIAQ